MSGLACLIGVSKSYGADPVLHDVDFEITEGETHVLAGENGAGKSTLIRIIGGVVTDYTGTVEIGGQPVRFRSPIDARRAGVAVIHQELSLIPSMSVADNLLLPDLPVRGGFVRSAERNRAAADALKQVGLDVPLDTPVERLPIAAQQLVEIAKALRHRARVVVMDEPTSALNAPEAERLFGIIANLKARGVGVVYISHKMDEIERLADRITVLRDGVVIASRPAAQMPPSELVALMVGRPAEPLPAHPDRTYGEVALRAEGITIRRHGRTVVSDVTVSARAGEVVGLAGLEGSGNSALLMGLFGAFGRIPGRVHINGAPVVIRSPRHAIRQRMALLTSDRKTTGLVLSLTVAANCTLAILGRIAPHGWRNERREREIAAGAQRDLAIRIPRVDVPVSALSGGNQQKVALAKWIAADPQILMLDEPTRGIDVGAKREIYGLIDAWRARGMAILLVTSELPELLRLADRILVMHRGRVVREFGRAEATAERIVEAAMNA